MFSLLLLIGFFIVVIIGLAAMNTEKTSGQKKEIEIYHPVGTAFHIDTSYLEELREETASDSSKAVKVWRKAIAKAEDVAEDLSAARDSLAVIKAVSCVGCLWVEQ